MAQRVHDLAVKIRDDYDGDAERVWRDAADGAALRANIEGLPGFGTIKVKALGSVLAKRFGVEAAQDLVPVAPDARRRRLASGARRLPGRQAHPQGGVVENLKGRFHTSHISGRVGCAEPTPLDFMCCSTGSGVPLGHVRSEAPDIAPAARRALQAALYESKRVIVGQDAMLERVLVALLAGGHVLLEGVPGLAKTLTVRTLAQVLGGSFSRVQFTPDLVPADLVGTRIWRPDRGEFRTELGPVFANLLLADEINRAPAKVQSALLEVMQEHQVTIGGTTYPVPQPFLVLATQNPIESEGTYQLPEAQVDRFLFKLARRLPGARGRGRRRRPRVDRAPAAARGHAGRRPARPTARAAARGLRRPRRRAPTRCASPTPRATRPRTASPTWPTLIEFGATPRASIGLDAGRAGARAAARPRPRDRRRRRDLAPDVLRHRLVLSYDALADGVQPDDLLDRVLDAVGAAARERARREAA